VTEAKTGLYAALARFQADLPEVTKGKTAKVTPEGKKPWSYKYADLAHIHKEALTKLGKHDLAFLSKPTLIDGEFVLAYSLVHASGEREDGVYPLGRGTPQQLGSLITYARRYAFCAITGIAPEGEDDDAQAAQQTDDWRSHAPVQPRQRFAHTDAEHERLVPGQNTEDRNGKKAERIKGKAPDDEFTTPAETDQKWHSEIEAEIKNLTTDEYGEVLRRRVVEKVQALGCTSEDGEKLRTLIRARRQALKVEREPAQEPADA
jgi:ERF superfamily